MKIPQVLSHVTVATAAAIVPRDGSEAVEKREDWTGDGNVEIYISDQKVNWGSLVPSSIVADALRSKCGANGCDTNWSHDSYFAENGKDWNAKVTFTMADDEYPTWQKNGLISLMESTIAEVAELMVVNKKKCHNPNPKSLCLGVDKIDQYWAPQTISIAIPASDGVEQVDMRIGVEIEEPEEPLFGLCTLTAGLAALLEVLSNLCSAQSSPSAPSAVLLLLSRLEGLPKKTFEGFLGDSNKLSRIALDSRSIISWYKCLETLSNT